MSFRPPAAPQGALHLPAGARRAALVGVVALAGLGGVPSTAPAAVTDEIVVRHRAAASAAERAELRADAGVQLERRLSLTGVEVVEASGSRAAALRELRADPDVLWAEANQVVRAATADQYWDLLYGLENDGGTGVADADIDAESAWTVSRGAGVTVAVVDTGVDFTHPDLAGQLLPGVNFVGDVQATPADDGHGHGTHVSGTVAAAENGIGVVGAAPASKVLPLRALGNDGTGSSAGVAAAFDYAGDQGVRVVNASLGAPVPTNVEREAITSHPDTLFVVAAGNSGADVDTSATKAYPCAYTYANVLCVGASDASDLVASFSNRGSTSVDLFAPGDAIASTYPDNQYVYLSGTSMASPMVAGAAALLASAHPSWTPAQLKSALLGTVDHRAAFSDVSLTGGRLNAARALGVDVGPDGEAPDQVAGLVALSGPGRVDLSWTVSAAADLAGYRVWRLVGGNWTLSATVTAAQASITGLTAGALESFRVTARDLSGEESAASPTASAVVLDGAPPADPDPAPATSSPEPSGTPDPGSVPGTPSPTAPEPAPLPELPPVALPGSEPVPPTPAQPVPAGEPSRLSRVRVLLVRGRPKAVAFRLSAAGRVRVTAVRQRTARVRARTITRTLDLTAGPQTLSLDRTARGLALSRATWRVRLQAERGRAGVLVRIR